MKLTSQRTFSALSLRANFSWTFAGNMVYAACQWGMLAALARLGSPEMVGHFALALAITGPVFLFSNLHLRNLQATDARRDFVFGDYLRLRLLTTVVAFGIIAAIVGVAGYRGHVALVIVTVGIAKAFEAVSDVYYGLLQQRECMDRIAYSLLIKGPLSLVALAGGVYLSGSLVWGVAALAASWALILLAYDMRNGSLLLRAEAAVARGEAGPLQQRRARLLTLAGMALPLGVGILFVSLSTAIPRYFVEYYLGAAALGVFAALAYVQMAGTIVVSALAGAANPRLSRLYAQADGRAFLLLLARLLTVGLLLGLAGMGIAALAGGPILALIYGPEYAAHEQLFVWVMAACGLSYTAWFAGDAMTATRHLRVQALLFASMALATVQASVWLIPRFELTGAALVLLITAAIHTGGGLLVVVWALWRLQRRGAAEPQTAT